MKSRFGRFILIQVILFGLTACGGKHKDGADGTKKSLENITELACDETFENIIQDEIEVYEFIYPKESILPYYLNETACVDSLLQGKVKTIVIPRELTEREWNVLKSKKQIPRSQQIAVDAIAIIVNKDNPVEILSTTEIGEILTGKITEWNQIEPSSLGKIDVVFDHAGSSTVKYMKEKVAVDGTLGDNVYAQGNSPAVLEAVRTHPNAIGIIGVNWLTSNLDGRALSSTEERAKESAKSDTIELASTNDSYTAEVKILKVREADKLEAYKPYQADIFSGNYPFYRSIYMITTGTGGMPSHRFFSFVTGTQGQKLILTSGILPAMMHVKRVELVQSK